MKGYRKHERYTDRVMEKRGKVKTSRRRYLLLEFPNYYEFMTLECGYDEKSAKERLERHYVRRPQLPRVSTPQNCGAVGG